MATDVDKKAIVGALAESSRVMKDAAKLGQSFAGKIDKVYLVGCGAPNRIMLGLEYWLQHYSPTLEVRRYFPAEFVTQNPARFDDRTLVLLGSKSGTTPETVQAAEFVKGRPCVTVAVTQTADLPLAKAVLGEIGNINTLHRGAVEQAGFAVLKAPDIPSILVETAFISNPEEEKKLLDEAYQYKMAQAIGSGIKRYFAKNPPLARTKLA